MEGGGGGSNSQRWIEHKIVFPRALLPSALRTRSFRARFRATSACSTRSFLSEMVPSRALSATASQTSRIPADRKSCIARVRCLASRRCFIYIYIYILREREKAIKVGRDVLLIVSFMLLYQSILVVCTVQNTSLGDLVKYFFRHRSRGKIPSSKETAYLDYTVPWAAVSRNSFQTNNTGEKIRRENLPFFCFCLGGGRACFFSTRAPTALQLR